MLFSAFQIISQIVKSNHGLKIAVLFTLRESRGRRISCVVKGSRGLLASICVTCVTELLIETHGNREI
jgi:hypothetical protein